MRFEDERRKYRDETREILWADNIMKTVSCLDRPVTGTLDERKPTGVLDREIF